eukprot:gene30450-23590_t
MAAAGGSGAALWACALGAAAAAAAAYDLSGAQSCTSGHDGPAPAAGPDACVALVVHLIVAALLAAGRR